MLTYQCLSLGGVFKFYGSNVIKKIMIDVIK